MKKTWVSVKKLLKIFGPGLITGASDDDPSGIATYSQAGASFGLATLWTALITFPLMAAIQEMCARIGMITSVGLTTTLKNHYPRPLLYLMLAFSVPAILLNIGADIAAMGAVASLMIPSVHPMIFSTAFTIILIVLIVYLPYQSIVSVLKYLCLSVMLYIVVPFFTHPHVGAVLKATFWPHIEFSREYLEIVVAILGTTISPYLFFWQVTMEAEDVKLVGQVTLARRRLTSQDCTEAEAKRETGFINKLIRKMQLDVNFGMFLSNMVMFFIILATGTAIYGHGTPHIDTVEQAAQALVPVAGRWAYLLFTVGVLGTGFLAIPVLSGSMSYIVSETFGWTGNLDQKYYQAKPFYAVIVSSLIIGLALNYIGLSPIKALIYTAILYGVTAPVMIVIVLHIANNKKIMGEYTNGVISNILGGLTLLLMSAAAIALVYFQFA